MRQIIKYFEERNKRLNEIEARSNGTRIVDHEVYRKRELDRVANEIIATLLVIIVYFILGFWTAAVLFVRAGLVK